MAARSGLAGSVMSERPQPDHCAARLFLASNFEGALIGAARQDLLTVDQGEQGPEQDAPIPLRYPVGANQLRSEVMPDEILTLGHHEFIQRVQEIEIAPLDATGLLLRLCASVEVHSTEPPGPGRHRGATTLAIRMDRSAATALFQQIREIFQKMGWQLPPQDAGQA
jgi:hypothetical protein